MVVGIKNDKQDEGRDKKNKRHTHEMETHGH
jgi:hypothetical protein